MSSQHPDPDALLARVQAEEAKQARGKLKIFFGAATGVGKTCSMLETARKAGKEGMDVVIGYIEPHCRPETRGNRATRFSRRGSCGSISLAGRSLWAIKKSTSRRSNTAC